MEKKKLLLFDIRKRKRIFKKIARLVVNGYGLWFSGGGVIGSGASSPQLMEEVIAPLKHHLAEIYSKKLLSTKKISIKIPEKRKFSQKPPIMLVSFGYLNKVINWQWLKVKFNLKSVNLAKKLIKSLYDNLLLHMILPIKKEYYDLFPFNKESQSQNKVVSAGFMCLGGYPPLNKFIKHYEKTAPKQIKNLPWPFMGTSLAHDGTESIVTSVQAYKYWLEMEIAQKEKVFILADSLMDEIVEKEWKRSESQSLIDFINGKNKEVLIRRRGTALPEIAKEILKDYDIKLSYTADYKDLYPNQEPPLTTFEQMKALIERLKI